MSKCSTCGDAGIVNVFNPTETCLLGMVQCPNCLHRYSVEEGGHTTYYIYRGTPSGPYTYLAACTSQGAADAAYRLLTMVTP